MAGLLDLLRPQQAQNGGLMAGLDQPPPQQRAEFDGSKGLIGGFLAQRTEQKNMNAAQAQAQAMRQQAMAAAQQLFPDNRQLQFLAAAKPEAFFSTIQEYSKPQKLGQGEQLATLGGAGGAYNPKTGFEGDVPYKLDQNGQATYGMARPKTYAETETEANNLRQDANTDAGLIETRRAHDQQYEIGRGNLGVAQSRLSFDRSKGAGAAQFSTMTDQQLLDLARTLK